MKKIEDNKINTPFKSFTLKYAYLNYERSKKKYKGLIICVFILMLLTNTFITFMNYTLKTVNEYVAIPNYDIALISNDDLNELTNKLKPTKKTIFKICTKTIEIPLENLTKNTSTLKDIMITNLGGNNIVNKVDEISEEDKKMSKISYAPFKNLNEITINDYKIKVNLTDKIPFGFSATSDTVILNLSSEEFNKICPIYENKAFIKTKKTNLDEYIENYALKNNIDLSYINVKKGVELTNNFLLLLKIFMYLCLILISLISFLTILNITSANIDLRKKEFSSLKVLGLTNNKINICLLFESLIISLKGTLYVFPFVLMISKYLYVNILNYFDIQMTLFNYKLFILSFIIIFILIFISMILSHKGLYKKSLIYNIKNGV